MKNGRKAAKSFLDWGLNPVPVKAGDSKVPVREDHNSSLMTKEEVDDFDFDNIGFSTGIISGGLEGLDFDLKNSEHPEAIMKVFKSKVPKKLLKKLVIQTSISGGYHMLYRCEEISSSKVLAKNSVGKAVIETRGEGGYFKCYPSEGYKIVQGKLSEIPIITPEERLQLFISAKMLNRTILREARKRATAEDSKYFKRFPDYNSDPEIGIDILEKHGWTVKNEDTEWYNLTRPDSESGDIHAGYHKLGMFLFVFSTAQDTFETERPYNNHAIFAELDCEGRYDKAYAKLYEQGHGVDQEGDEKTKATIIQEAWDRQLEDLTFLSDEVEENGYLEQVRKDEVELGLTTGWKALDEYFRLKLNSLNVGLGYDGVGKSLLMLSIAAASQVMHDWKWGMIMPENKTGMSRRRLIECMYGSPVKTYKNSATLFDQYLKESRESFKIISNKKHYSIRDVLEMGKRLYEYYGINALLIDPYNFFKVEGNSHSHNNEILSELRVFAEQYCSVYVMAHPSSFAPRNNKEGDGFLIAPNKYQIQGGADFPYRVDDFFILHRIVNHPDKEIQRTMQFIMEKVKETETGGKVHPNGEWSTLEFERRNEFLGYWDSLGQNPMYNAMVSRMGVRAKLRNMSPEDAF